MTTDLEEQLQEISKEIYRLKEEIERSSNPNNALIQELKTKQYQALFYIEKIHNLKQGD